MSQVKLTFDDRWYGDMKRAAALYNMPFTLFHAYLLGYAWRKYTSSDSELDELLVRAANDAADARQAHSRRDRPQY